MLPDVNGDGYDDWGAYWAQLGQFEDTDGYYIFFGGEEPDAEPDRDLEGNHALGGTDGVISGGNFNNDGFGDVVTANIDAYMWDGELHIYFGSQWFCRDAAIIVNTYESYGASLGKKLGAIGDYNGDGLNDFIACTSVGEFAASRHVLFSGSNDWRVSVSRKERFNSIQWDITVTPNPFNDSVNLSYSCLFLSST